MNGEKEVPKKVLLHVINLFKEGFDNFSEYSDEFYQKIVKGQITLSAKVSISLLYYTYIFRYSVSSENHLTQTDF